MGMTLTRFGCYLAVASVMAAGLFACSPVVFIPDNNLEAVVRAELGKPLSLFLTQADLAQVNTLDASGNAIRSLEGLQYCVNLRKLHASDNDIGRIDVLAGLTNVTYLHLGNNRISDIEAVAGLPFLEYLNLSGDNNAIADWGYLEDNVVTGGLGAGAVVVVSEAHTLDGEGNPLPGFVGAYNAMLDAGVIVQFVS